MELDFFLLTADKNLSRCSIIFVIWIYVRWPGTNWSGCSWISYIKRKWNIIYAIDGETSFKRTFEELTHAPVSIIFMVG